MNKIAINVLNPQAVKDSIKTMVFAARLTQRGHTLETPEDVLDLYERPYTPELVSTFCNLPHPTIQKFGVINIVITGASRRFLAQITRHQNEVKFMSASLQYSDYSGFSQFCIPYECFENDAEHVGSAQYADDYFKTQYINSCNAAMNDYARAAEQGLATDACGYMAPQGLRNVLLISATPYQWKHMISQRACRRNTPETRYVLLKVWEELYNIDPAFFSPETFGTPCMLGKCPEGKMSCGKPIPRGATPQAVLESDFKHIYTAKEV